MDQWPWMPTPVMGTPASTSLFEQAVYAFSFFWPFGIVVIIEQLRLRVGGVSVFKCFGDEFVAADAVPGRIAQDLGIVAASSATASLTTSQA